MPSHDELPVSVAAIEQAAAGLAGLAVRTPLLESPLLNARLSGRLLVKAECLQRTGSFKFRGAYNAVAAAGGRPVVAFSSGNHAQGVAHAAQILRTPATIVMPADAPDIKLANTRAYGAEVILYDRKTDDREAIGTKIAREQGAVLVRPYDDPRVMAGQGTLGLEIVSQCDELGIVPDAVIAPASGGGLIAGVAMAIKDKFAAVEMFCAEPAGFDDHARSLKQGERIRHDGCGTTICDALMAAMPGELTFQVNRQLLTGGLVVDDDAVQAAMLLAFRWFKLVVEPGGAVALASVLSGKVPIENRVVVAILSGGNVDGDLFARVVGGNTDA